MSELVSSLISMVFRDPENSSARTFSEDCKKLFSLSDEDMQDCLSVLPDYRLLRLTNEKKELLDKFLEQHPKLARPQIESAFSVLNFFLKQLADNELPTSDSDKWAADLGTLKILSSKDASRLDVLLSSLRRINEDVVSKEVERRTAAQRVGELFRGCSIAVNVRGVLDKKYLPGTSYENFCPEVNDIVVVATMSILAEDDSDAQKRSYCNLEESDLDYLINCLQAAKKEIVALKSYIGMKK